MSSDPATYVEGVPVKISEKYRPPRKVALSPYYNYTVNADVLTTEYNLINEYETLKWLEDTKLFKENQRVARKEAIRKYEKEKEEIKQKQELLAQNLEEEKKRKLLEEEERIQKEESENKICEKENDPESEIVQEEKEDINENEENSEEQMSHSVTSNITLPIPTGIVPVNSNSIQSTHSTMLVPTQCSPQVSYHKSPSKTSSINFADFEGDASDPFDSAALESINDMEELAKVLQSTNVKQQKSFSNSEFNYQQNEAVINGGYTLNSYPYNYQPFHLHADTSTFNPMTPYLGKNLFSNSIPTVPSAVKSGLQHDTFPTNRYSRWNQLPPNSSTTSEMSHFKNYNYLSQANLPSDTNVALDNNTFANINSTYPNISTHLVGSPLTTTNIQALNSGIEAVGKRQDLEDFYTRYYSNKKSTLGAHSGDSTPTNYQQNSKSILSSSSSVPDLTAVEDTEVSRIVSNNHLERSFFKGSSSFDTPRSSSTGGYEGLGKCYQITVASPNTTAPNNKLPDPFTELNEEAQSLVQNMAEMGFPRPRVARAVQKLGTDHKKLLEVLLTLQSFQENGDDECLSERAFYFFMGEVDKVKEFLLAAKTLLDLGFEEERVVENLFKHQNDKEKCLEELIV